MVTLREVTGDPEELAALQRIRESDEGFALRVTGHPPGPADAQSTLISVPGVVRTNDQVLGFWRRLGFTETGEVRPWRYDKLESEAILMDKPVMG